MLAPTVEYELGNAVTVVDGQETLTIPPDQAMRLVGEIAEAWKAAMQQGHEKVAMLCQARVRMHLAEMLSRQVRQLPVLAYDEIAVGTPVEPVGTISIPIDQPQEQSDATTPQPVAAG